VEGENLNLADLSEYVAIGSMMFPAEDWVLGKNRISGMLKKWPQGIFVLRDFKREIVAYRTLWPLNERASVNLIEGILRDDEINASALVWKKERMKNIDWLMGAIAVRERVVGRDRARCIGMLLESIDEIISRYQGRRVLAHAATESGLKFLIKNDFEFAFAKDPTLGVRKMKTPLMRNIETNKCYEL